MKGLPLALLVAALAPAAPAAAAPEPSRTYLASITGIALGRNDYVGRFTIDTWGVDILAVCRVPPGWRVRAGRSAAPDGVIEGEATHGVTYIRRMSALHGLALVRIYGGVRRRDRPVPHGRVPATFSGGVEIGSYRPGRARSAPLTAANIRLTPATRCPPPR